MARRLAVVPETPPRALGIVRVSDERGRGDNLLSPDIQRTAITDHCGRSGYVLTGPFVEAIDESGSRAKSAWWAKLDAAVERVEAGEVDVIVVWKFSRAARNRRRWAVTVDRVEAAGGRLESATEPNEPNASGRFARGVLAELAAFEAERIGETWVEVQRNRFGRGLTVNGQTPWGWTRRDGQLVADEQLAPAIVEAYRRYLAGDGMMAIAAWLTSAGWPTATGVPWHPTVVRGMLDNPIHAGKVRYKGVVRDGAHTGIIDAATWEAYQAARRRRASAPRTEASRSWLAGLCRCGICGGSMAMNVMRKRDATYAVYRCDRAAMSGAHPHASLSSRRVEAAVLEWLEQTAAADIDAAPPQRLATSSSAREIKRLERQIVALDKDLTNLTVQLARQIVPESAYAAARDEITAERESLARQRQQLHDEQVLAPAALATSARNLLEEWDELPVTRRREALARMIRHVHVTPGLDWVVDIEPVLVL